MLLLMRKQKSRACLESWREKSSRAIRRAKTAVHDEARRDEHDDDVLLLLSMIQRW